jgi:hypothetical protein
MIKAYPQKKGHMQKKGILVASDLHTEWLLPWWWERYSSCNTLPVVFVDLGMSSEIKDWCKERGNLYFFQESIEDKPLTPEVLASWEKSYGKTYERSRSAWFKKPLACLLSPFEETVWIDLDCEVLCNIEHLFDFLEKGKELAIYRSSDGDNLCNSGVVVFKKNSPLLKKWGSIARQNATNYWGDENILSELIQSSEETIAFIPKTYNWRVSTGIPDYAHIIHWVGEWGKEFIKKHGGLKSTIEKLSFLD